MVVVESQTPEDVQLVMHNIQRVKTQAELLFESQYYLSLIPKQQGKRTDLNDESDSSLIDSLPGDRYKKAEQLMGGVISDQTIRRMDRLVEAENEAIQSSNTEYQNLGLLRKMTSGEISPSHAVKLLDDYIKYGKERKEHKHKRIGISINPAPSYRLINKSSESMEEVESNSIQTVVTSCPYYNARNYSNGTSEKNELGQDESPDIFINRLLIHFAEVYRVLNDEGSLFLNIAETGIVKISPLITNRLIIRLCDDLGFKCVNEIIWHKTNPKSTPSNRRLSASYEKIVHLVKTDRYYYEPLKIWREDPMILMGSFQNRSTSGVTQSKPSIRKPYYHFKDFIDEQKFEDVITSAVVNTSLFKKIDPAFDHPAPFDPRIALLGILTTSKPGDCVLDPFSGTASCGEMALMLGRQYVGYELNQEFHEFAEKRIPYTTQGYDPDSVSYFEDLKLNNDENLQMAG